MSNIGNSNMRYVTFIVTQNCNLNCTYCYEHNKTKNSFDVNLAKEIILRELSIKDNYTEICFDFFGGEPFLEFDKIKEIVEFFKDRKFDKKVYFLLEQMVL
ncbi:radical SAM domain protein [Clostridium sp. CAG:524]|nr:radical SAM domain protein [Clostridium sp. CAG:524]